MGCDIHMHIEVLVNGKWEHYSAPDVPRNYILFAKLAGVRGESKDAIVPPRGFPRDASVITNLDYELWEGDAHSYSWLNYQEIREICAWWKEQWPPHRPDDWIEGSFGYFFGNSWERIPAWTPAVTDVRWVFWFDN